MDKVKIKTIDGVTKIKTIDGSYEEYFIPEAKKTLFQLVMEFLQRAAAKKKK